MAHVHVTDTGGLDVTPAVDLLTAAGHSVTLPGTGTGTDHATAGAPADTEALIVSFARIDATVLDALPHLRVIATTTMGADQIDTRAAAARGVEVHTLPPLSAEDVATHALAGTLSLLRRLPQARAAAPEWDFTRIPVPPRISGLTVGIYGMGRIAGLYARYARPLFGHVAAYDPYLPADAWPEGIDRVTDPDDLFRCADVLTLHVPLTEQTRHTVNARTLALMPAGSHIVNVSRGELVDAQALIRSLDSGHTAGAFLDVLEDEPPAPDSPLLHRDDVTVTPHTAFYSSATARSYVTTPARAVADALERTQNHSPSPTPNPDAHPGHTMNEHTRTGGDVVVETLTRLGVTDVFGIPGQHALGLFDALGRSDIRFISSRVENNSAFNADGYARATGRVGVLLVSTGPGALTTLGALQEAYVTGVPVLVISSQVPRRGLGGTRNGLLHQLDDQQKSAQNVTRYTAVARDASHIPTLLTDAWSVATTAPAGPVWVEIPEDVLLGPADIPPVTDIRPRPTPRPARSELTAEAARLLASSRRPVILAGGGVRRSPTGSGGLRRVAEALDAPVVSTVGGKGAFPFDHPLSAASWIEDRYTTDLLEDADVLLAVGTSLGEVTSNYFTLSPRGTLIQIDAEPRVLSSNHPSLGIPADAGEALNALADALADTPAETPAETPADTPRRDGSTVAAELRQRVGQRLADQDLAPEQGVLADIRAATPADTDTFWDMTIAAYWAWSAWDPREGGFHSAQGSGGLGFAFPAALAAAVGSGRHTLAVSGDGGAMYGIAELAAARQHDADVTWLIVDDGGYGILREYMTDAFDRTTATELARPDFVALAGAFGIPARHTDPEHLRDTLAEALATPGPSVVVLGATLQMFAPTHLS